MGDHASAGGPLDGVHVVELSQLIAGPSASQLLVDYGASVIKVEPPQGDAGRELRSIVASSASEAPTFLAYNRGKELRRVDLRSPAGREEVMGLLDSCDVVIESSRPGAMERLGLGPTDVWARNPGAVYASVSGFGWDGPEAFRRGVDLVVQAESGIMALTGDPDGEPMKVGFTMVDAATGHALCHGILAALLERARTGTGSLVRVSLRDVAMHLQAAPIMEYLLSGTPPPRSGNGAPMTAPADLYRTADGAIVISAYADAHWIALCDVLDAEEMCDDPRFVSKKERVRNRAELKVAIEDRLGRAGSQEWLSLLHDAGLVVGEVKGLDEAVEGALERGTLLSAGAGSASPGVHNPVSITKPTQRRS